VNSIMNEIVLTTFRSLVDFLPSELAIMPLSRWSESVLRYFYCRILAERDEENKIEQFVECNKIDLVLRQGQAIAFVEFKFYRHAERFDPYAGRPNGYKGGPGPKNLGEFQSCVERLYQRPVVPGLSKYIVLVYADPTSGARPMLRYSRDYDDYRHLNESVPLRVLESVDVFGTSNEIVRARLYEMNYPPNRVANSDA
jgi:hypothetical protein